MMTVEPIRSHVTGTEPSPGLILWIPGPPKGMHRPRTRVIQNKQGGRAVAQVYTEPADQQVMHEIRDLWREQGSIVLDGFIAASLRLYMARPKSHFNTRGELNKAGLAEPLPARKPDLDNAAKIVLDALNGCAYADDCQIVDLHVHRRWTNDQLATEGMLLLLREIPA
jgi:Holliday junction resolvase RusA-like endonuclease